LTWGAGLGGGGGVSESRWQAPSTAAKVQSVRILFIYV
jgi:hypothetical protein